jgi:hypothetical protein
MKDISEDNQAGEKLKVRKFKENGEYGARRKTGERKRTSGRK